ncbi:hypothetical protein RGQ13_00595 [Thalassotalea psychrophila]|uniref:Uncharacterized protein n=1 Tax=Thalassotalea psychrophila TaxID=3065647 RepID=A0ABY9TVA0_9GAMM|nr:hypothetical protein RGQ13_00595 [Colwelliaceae bacterium SQ149]
MNQKIEVSTEIFNRLAKHASGFDTPANVIVKLLDFYEDEPKFTQKTKANLIEQAFKLNFKTDARPFGQKASVLSGFSDDSKGVQWNVVVNSETGIVSLGVNLEGMKYKNWPITNLLIRESKQSKLLNLVNTESSNEIRVNMTRDAWQAASRPLIAERNISPQGLMLSELTSTIWSDILNESLGCLNKREGYKGRGKQVVTRIKSGDTKEMEVSPHLGFRVTICETKPTDLNKLLNEFKKAQAILMPIYNFVAEQSK